MPDDTPSQRGQRLPAIDLKRCTGCAYCAIRCPFGVITMQEAGTD